MSLNKNSSILSPASTTGAGIAIGINPGISSIIVGSAATTLTIVSGTAVQMIVTTSIDFYPPISIAGVVTGTSSGGSFSVAIIPE